MRPDFIRWTDKQAQACALADAHRFTLYGGARGPGKSFWLRGYAIRRLVEWASQGHLGVRAMLACEDYPSLRDRQIVQIQLWPGWLGEWKAAISEYHLKPRFGGGQLCLRNLDDPSKYQSAEFALMAIDELTKNPPGTFDILRGSLRWPGIDRPQFIAASNPTGLGATWVRQLWVERDFPDYLKPLASEFAFLPGLARDNPYLPESYWQELQTLPPVLRKAWADGDWYAGVEGLVYGEFTQDNIVDEEPLPELPCELAVDDGYIDPRAILFIQNRGDHVLVFDELYHCKHLAETCVAEVNERIQEYGMTTPELAVGSPEAVELHEQFRRANIAYRNGEVKVIPRVELLHGLFCDAQGHRHIRVNRRVKNLIREITEGYVYPEGTRALHEKPVDANDHAVSALQYWASRRCRT